MYIHVSWVELYRPLDSKRIVAKRGEGKGLYTETQGKHVSRSGGPLIRRTLSVESSVSILIPATVSFVQSAKKSMGGTISSLCAFAPVPFTFVTVILVCQHCAKKNIFFGLNFSNSISLKFGVDESNMLLEPVFSRFSHF